MIVNISDPSIIATQRDPTVRISILTIVNAATGIIARFDPLAGRGVHERIEEVRLCGGCAEARYEVRFIFANSVHAYF
jgi:hypothetical protein